MCEDSENNQIFISILYRSVMGWSFAVLFAVVGAILANRFGLPTLFAAQTVMGLLGFIGGLSQTYSIRAAGREIFWKQSLLLSIVWGLSCIGGVTPLFFTFGSSIKMSLLGFSSFIIFGALGGLTTTYILNSAHQNTAHHDTTPCIVIWAFSFGLAAISVDLFGVFFQIFLPKSVSLFLAFGSIAVIVGIGNGYSLFLFFSAGKTDRQPLKTHYETISKEDDKRYILTLVLLAVPFYLNDLSNIFIKDWRLWLLLDLILVKLLPLTVALWLIHRQKMKPTEFGLTSQPLAGYVIVFVIGTLAGTYLLQNGYVLFNFLSGYRPLGSIPIIENPLWKWFDVTVGLLLVGICEELVFRGYLSAFISRYTQRAPVIILVSALAFGFIHWSEGFNQVAVAFTIGAVFMMLYLRFGSLPALMLAHFTINFIHSAGIIPKDIFRFQ